MELQKAWRDVIRPTMRREPKTPGNRGVEVVMVDLDGDGIPDPPAPTPTLLPIDITADGVAYDPVNETLEGTAGDSLIFAAVPAAHELISLSYTWSVRSGSARLTPSGSTCVVDLQSTEVELVNIQVDIRDTTGACPDTPQVVRFAVMTRPALQALAVAEPTVTGDPLVGQTLTCSRPEITGGSGDVTVNYYWQDAGNKRVLYMGATQLVADVDLGRTECCQVYVVDNQTGENFTVVSNTVGPITRPN